MSELYEGNYELSKTWVSCLEALIASEDKNQENDQDKNQSKISLSEYVVNVLSSVGFIKNQEEEDIEFTFTMFLEICHMCIRTDFKLEYKFVIVYTIFDLLFLHDSAQAELNKAVALFGITGKEVALFSAIWLLYNQIPGIHPDIYFENLISDSIPKCIERDVKDRMDEIIQSLKPESTVARSKQIYDAFLSK